MTRRPLLLFDVDGVLVGKDELRRLPGAAEALAQLRHDGSAVLSLVTDTDEDVARHRTTVVGVERYLDFTVGSYGPADAGVSDARSRAERSYGDAFTTVVVTADSVPHVTRARSSADLVVAVASAEPAATQLREAGADHVVASLTDLVPLVRASAADAAP